MFSGCNFLNVFSVFLIDFSNRLGDGLHLLSVYVCTHVFTCCIVVNDCLLSYAYVQVYNIPLYLGT